MSPPGVIALLTRRSRIRAGCKVHISYRDEAGRSGDDPAIYGETGNISSRPSAAFASLDRLP